jgi:hypothetical protein
MYGFKYNKENYKYEFTLNPFIDSHKKIVGELRLLHKYHINNRKKFETSVSIRSFMHTYNQKEDYELYYHKISPNVRYVIKDNLENKRYIDLMYSYINEEHALGQDFKKFNFGSNLVKLRYTDNRFSMFQSNKKQVFLEYMNYENLLYQKKNFLKLTGILNQMWLMSKCRELNFRLFASYFIQNTDAKSNSFSNQLTKGSIALIHQGFNDYGYEEYYTARNDRGGFLTNQTSYHLGGGFKNAASGGNNVGMSNVAAFSMNTAIDIVKHREYLVFLTYFDGGGYGRYSNEKFSMRYIYSAGLGVKIGDIFAIYLPMINSKSITESYISSKLSFFERVNFRFTYKNTFTDRL